MFEARETVVVNATPQEVLEFVADFRRYAEADTKIRRIREVHREGNDGYVRHGGQLRGVPGPMLTSHFHIDPGRSLTVRADHWMLRLEGLVTCSPAEALSSAKARWMAMAQSRPFFADWKATMKASPIVFTSKPS